MLRNIEIDDPSWSETLRTLRHDVYHLAPYSRIEAHRRGATARAFVAQDGGRVFFAPYLLRRCDDVIPELDTGVFDITSPYGYPGPLLSEQGRTDPGFIDAVLQAIRHQMSTQCIASAFFRLHPILNRDFPSVRAGGWIARHGESVCIDLTLPAAKLWSTTRKGHQSSINKSRRLGVSVEFLPLHCNIRCLTEVYRETMGRVKATPDYHFDDTYFAGLAELGSVVEVGIARVGGRLAGACIFFESCGIVQAHLGGTMDEFLSHSPLMLILDEARRRYKERGAEFLHLGSGFKGKTGDAIYNFKSGFSRQRFELSALCLVGDAALYERLSLARALALRVNADDLQSGNFFPGYRAG